MSEVKTKALQEGVVMKDATNEVLTKEKIDLTDKIKTAATPVATKVVSGSELSDVEKAEMADRAVDNRVRLKVGVIGCGNAGNQCLTALYHAGITEQLYAINTSKKDLSDEVINHLIPSFVAGYQGRGSGKDRDLAKALFKENGSELFTDARRCNRIFHECDIVVVVFSTGGGTGSSIGPALCGILSRMYANSTKLVIAYGIAPKFIESSQSHKNNIAAINECMSYNIPILLDDLCQLEDDPLDVAYAKVATNFVNYIKTIRGDFSTPSTNGMIDENDTLRLIGYPGYQVHYHLSKLTAEMLEKEDIQKRFLDEMKNSPTMNIQKDGIMQYMGVFSNYPSSFEDGVHNGNYSELINYVGFPDSTFENNGSISGNVADVHIIMSGLTLPYNRILQSKEKVEEREARREKGGSNIDLSMINEEINGDTVRNKIQNANIVKDTDIADAVNSFFNI